MKSNVVDGEKGDQVKTSSKVTFSLIEPGKDKLWFITFNKVFIVIAGSGLMAICFTIIFPHLNVILNIIWISSMIGYSIADHYRFDILKNSDYTYLGKISFDKNEFSINKQVYPITDSLIIFGNYYIRGKRQYRGQNRHNGFSKVEINGVKHEFLIKNEKQYLRLLRLLEDWEKKKCNVFELPGGDKFFYFFIASEPVIDWNQKEQLKERYLKAQETILNKKGN